MTDPPSPAALVPALTPHDAGGGGLEELLGQLPGRVALEARPEAPVAVQEEALELGAVLLHVRAHADRVGEGARVDALLGARQHLREHTLRAGGRLEGSGQEAGSQLAVGQEERPLYSNESEGSNTNI